MVFDYAKINAIARMTKLNPLQINIMKYGIVIILLNGYLEESINFVYIPNIYYE